VSVSRHGVGTRRESHRFVVVVYGRDGAAPAAWPGNVVHVPAAPLAGPEGEDAVRVPFEQLDGIAGVLSDLIDQARAGPSVPRKAMRA
jgi:hypothetical protein